MLPPFEFLMLSAHQCWVHFCPFQQRKLVQFVYYCLAAPTPKCPNFPPCSTLPIIFHIRSFDTPEDLHFYVGLEAEIKLCPLYSSPCMGPRLAPSKLPSPWLTDWTGPGQKEVPGWGGRNRDVDGVAGIEMTSVSSLWIW